jgi:hypothetical protein
MVRAVTSGSAAAPEVNTSLQGEIEGSRVIRRPAGISPADLRLISLSDFAELDWWLPFGRIAR